MAPDILDGLIARGWTLACESPLELEHTNGSRLCGEEAQNLIAELEQSIRPPLTRPDDYTQKLQCAYDACRAVFGEPPIRDLRQKVLTTPQERERRAEKERQIFRFMSDRSLYLERPHRVFKRVADTDVDMGPFKLDGISEDGHYIVDLRHSPSYFFSEFDDRQYGGAAITAWKLKCAELACGCPGPYSKKFPREHAFRNALFVYCDMNEDLYQLPLSRFFKIQQFLVCRNGDPLHPRLTFSRFFVNIVVDEETGETQGDDMCWYVPTCYWEHLGNLRRQGNERFQIDRDYVTVPDVIGKERPVAAE